MGKDRGKNATPANNYWTLPTLAGNRKIKGKIGDAGVTFSPRAVRDYKRLNTSATGNRGFHERNRLTWRFAIIPDFRVELRGMF